MKTLPPPSSQTGSIRKEVYHLGRRIRNFRELEQSTRSVYSTLKPEEQQYIKNIVVRGMTITDSIMDAFTPTDRQLVALTRSLPKNENMQLAMHEAMDAIGLDLTLMARTLKEGMQANKSASFEGEIIESDVPDHNTRKGFLEIALKLTGLVGNRPELPAEPDPDVSVHQKNKELDELDAQMASIQAPQE